jgi:MoaA/NifB/PqqE/SkfB family radical SAM enzyme
MQITRFQHRTKLGLRYVKEYLMDEVSEGYGRTYLPSRPLDVICEISYVCNLECPTCFRWTAKPDEHELTAEQWQAALLKLRNWLGTFNLTFTGGEPFLRKDILDIFRFAADHGIVTGVVSNGSLIDKELARKIVASGLDGLTLSLNSMVPEIHNKTRGTNAAFDEVMRALDNMQDRNGMRLVLSTTIVKDSVKGLIDVVEFVKKRGLYGINFQPIMPASILPIYDKNGHTRRMAIGSTYKALLEKKDNAYIDDVFNRLLSMKASGYPILNSEEHLREMAKYLKDPTTPEILEKVCKVGIKNLNIDPFGNVRLCSIMSVVGNILTDDPENIWRSLNASQQREEIRTCDKTCRLMFCNYKKLDFKYKAKRVLQGLTE